MADVGKALRTALADLAKRHKITEDKALAVGYGIEAFRLSEDEAREAASYDGGNDRGIDFFLADDEWERVVIAQFKNLKNASRFPKIGDLALLLATLDELAEPQELLDAGRTTPAGGPRWTPSTSPPTSDRPTATCTSGVTQSTSWIRRALTSLRMSTSGEKTRSGTS